MDEWNTKICINDMHGDLQPESSGWLFKSQLAGAGHIAAAPLQARQLVSICIRAAVQFINTQKGTRQSTYLR